MPTRIVEIRRRKNTTRLPDDVYQESKRKVGSTFTASGDVRTGLTMTEEKEIMPFILGISTSDVNFHREVKEFFKTLTIEVPVGGVKLEAGLDEKGNPINALDYIKYKFAISHPDVAMEENGEIRHSTYKFYIHDKAAKLEKEHKESLVRKEALKEYIKLTGNEKRMDMVLRVLGADPASMNEKEKELFLEKEATTSHELFLKVVQDKNLETVSFIQECLSKGVLRKEGNTLFNIDEAIGANQEEAIAYLQDKKNSDVLMTLNARLKAAK
jgi:hypothetical protein